MCTNGLTILNSELNFSDPVPVIYFKLRFCKPVYVLACLECALMCLHENLDCIHRVNAKGFETSLKVGALNRIQHEERETWGRTQLLLHALQIAVIPRPSHRTFLTASSF